MIVSQERLNAEIEKVLPSVIELRRKLHSHPEFRFKEWETRKTIRERLEGKALDIKPSYIETDTIAILEGRAAVPNVTLRADIDALPMEDQTDTAWKSVVPGMAHGCGHDGHTAILLGVLEVLCALREEIPGSVRFIFQPGEEQGGGGKALVEKGVLTDGPKAEAVFGLHGWPGLPVRRLASIPGPMMAAEDNFAVTIRGRGGHAAIPHTCVDPVLIGARLIEAFHTIVSRNLDPLTSAVLSVCSVHAGEAENIIPDNFELKGTVRYFLEQDKIEIKKRIHEYSEAICRSAGAECEVSYRDNYIALKNDPEMVRLAEAAVTAYIGEDRWLSGENKSMTAEDFAFYLAEVPGAFLRLGLGEDWTPLHNPKFDFNDDVLADGIAALCSVVFRFFETT
jgi:amidohydrolase